MTTKTKNKAMSNTKSSHTKASNKPGNKKKAPVKKHHHGTVLTIALGLMAFHGLAAAGAYNSMSTAPEIQRPWIISMMVLHSLANIVAAAGIYSWKKWGLYVYAASTVLALVAGLLAVGSLSIFYIVMPLAILGWLLRTKWDYFE
jgi:hypothetical protein